MFKKMIFIVLLKCLLFVLNKCFISLLLEAPNSPKVAHTYLKLVQIGGALPVLVVADARHAGEADGYAVGRVHLRL